MTDTTVSAGQTSTGITLNNTDGVPDTLTVLSGGKAIDTINNGGLEFVSGTVSNTTLGGTETVDSGGTASGTTVNNGGTQDVLSSGTTISTILSFGGQEIVESGGTSSKTVINDGGLENVYGTASGTTVNSGGTEIVEPGGTAIGTTVSSGGTLSVTSGGTAIGTVNSGGQVIDDNPCFAAGTRIATARGDIPVEHLTVGDLVQTRSGDLTPIKWLGHRSVDCTRHPRPWDVWPVRIRAGAFADGMPRRDLVVSPDHSVFVEDVLIPIRYLINGATVVQEQVERVTYWHVELHRHDVILAEGLPAESYLDTGNRGAFANGDAAVQLHPDFAMKIWEARACAPLEMSGPARERAHAGLLDRLPSLGYTVTEDPALHFLADDGEALAAQAFDEWLCIALPEGATTLRIVSRQFAPAELDPARTDRRRLGVALTHLRLDHERLALDDPRFLGGWQACEPKLRWTDGAGVLDVSGACVVELRFTPAIANYVVPPAAGRVTVRATRRAGR